MKKVFFKTMAFAVMFSMTVSGLSLTNLKAEGQPGSEETKNYIVVTKNDSSFDAVSEEYEDTISDATADYENLEDENILITEMTASEAQSIESESGVLLVEEDGLVTASRNNNSNNNSKNNNNKEKTKANKKENSKNNIDKEWNIKAVNADDENKDSIIASSEKIKVAIIDSGLDVTENIDVAGRINLIPGEEEVLPLFEDTTGHGTSIAGIIVANNDYEYSDVKGINDQVELYSAKVLDYTNSAPISRVIEGIYWAIDQDVDIINLSFGTSQNSEALYLAIKAAYDAGILIIAASGNAGGTIEYPAAYPEVMAVGSVDATGTISDFCSTGADMEVVAPGELIKSTGGFGGEIIVSGTSMAVPHVVGIASILWQKDEAKSADFIRQLINESANYLGDENIYGNGLVDLSYALEIYDEFASTYVPNSGELNINNFENDSVLDSFSDVDYVEGRWTGSGHELAVSYGNITSSNTPILNSAQLTIIKAGAIFPDSAYYGMNSYPQLHGYYNYSNNYVASYEYAINCAKVGYGISTGSTIGRINLMYGELEYMRSYKGYSAGSSSAKLFLTGVAIHTGTDIFAHSTLEVTTHPLADDTTYISQRFNCAVKVANYAILRYLGYYSTTNPSIDLYNTYYNYSYGSFNLNSFYNFYLQAVNT